MEPLVSIVVPMRNAERFIGATLASLRPQDDPPLEIVVVDDGSSDRSAAVVAASGDDRVRLIDGPRAGIAAAFNAGLAAARGEIVMRCDADDLYAPGRVARQVGWLRSRPAYDAVCGAFATIDAAGRLIREMDCGARPEEITDELRRGVTRTHFGTFAVRAVALRALGGCRTYFDSAEDIDLLFRLGETGRVYYLPDLCYAYRLHDLSHCHRMSRARRHFYDEMARTFQQQRQRSGVDALAAGRAPAPPGDGRDRWPARDHQQGLLLGLAWEEHRRGNRRRALAAGWRSLRAQPANITVWRSLIALLLKPAGRP